jgi:hypothetical protein
MKRFSRVLAVFVLFAGGLTGIAARPSAANAAIRTCTFKDFDQFSVTALPIIRGLQTTLVTNMVNVSSSSCSISCRATPVAARVIATKGGAVAADISPAANEGCPPDPTTEDGVEHREVKQNAQYTVPLRWNQGVCKTPTTCKPAAPGQYRVQVGWSIRGGTQIKTAFLTIGKESVCPKTAASRALLSPWCVGVTKTPPSQASPALQTTIAS